MAMLKNLNAYKLKCIAIIAMVLNHIVIAWWEIIPLWLAYPFYAAGGLTFPIMGFFVVEGYKHTRNLKRYVLRIVVTGLIALPFHYLTIGLALEPSLNIMFTIALSFGVLVMYDKIRSRILFGLIYVFLVVPISLVFEWSFAGVSMVLLFYIIKNEKRRRILPPVCAVLLSILFSLIFLISGVEMPEIKAIAADPDFEAVNATFILGILLASILLLNFNGERGKETKWLFYIFYPVHLAVLAAVAIVLEL